jgi:hypothetical protein
MKIIEKIPNISLKIMRKIMSKVYNFVKGNSYNVSGKESSCGGVEN